MVTVIRMFSKADLGEAPTVADFLVSFKGPDADKAPVEKVKETVEEAMARVRASGFGVLLAMAEEAASSTNSPGTGIGPPPAA